MIWDVLYFERINMQIRHLEKIIWQRLQNTSYKAKKRLHAGETALYAHYLNYHITCVEVPTQQADLAKHTTLISTLSLQEENKFHLLERFTFLLLCGGKGNTS